MQDLFEKKLLPAVTLNDSNAALRLAETYLEAGLDIMEVTFRTEATLSAIEAVNREFSAINIGAGTILEPDQIIKAKNAGAQFGLAPGLKPDVLKAAQDQELPFIPGIVTPSEIELALSMGCSVLKLFPAELSGGIKYVKSLEGPYRQTGVRFIPMGGINQQNMDSYLHCESVLAVGGSWMAPKDKISKGDFASIGQVIHETLQQVKALG